VRPLRERTAWAVPLMIVAVLALLVSATACGNNDEAENGAPPATAPTETAPAEPTEPTVIEIPAAEQGLAFAVTEVRAPAGEITLRMPNPSSIPHDIAIDEPRHVEGEVVGQGGVSEVTAEFEPGRYEYYCSVPGHREGGMVGTLIVE
jgi:plastocyanin